MSGKHSNKNKKKPQRKNIKQAPPQKPEISSKLTKENKKVLIALICALVIVIGAVISAIIIINSALSDVSSESLSAAAATESSTAVAQPTVKPNKKTKKAKTDPTAVSAVAKEETEADLTQAQTDSKNDEPDIPDKLKEVCEDYGYDPNLFDFTQLIVVDSNSDCTADISFYEKNGSSWKEALPSATGFVGADGVGEASETVSKTPEGLFGIPTAFGFDQTIDTGLDYFQITEDTYWVDDPNSKYYNMHVEGTEDMDWESAEHMIDYPGNYNYGFVFDYNTNPIVKGAGSAFFMHVNEQPTHGCVAASQDIIVSALSWLNAEANPHILIV